MSRNRILPPTQEIEKLVDKGLTHKQIAERLTEELGVRIAPSTVSADLLRHGKTKSTVQRYDETVPWRVKPQHTNEYPVRMLRLLGRRLENNPMDDVDARRLASWMAKLVEERLVVGYCPDGTPGFRYIDAKHRTKNQVAPIRVESLRLDELA